MNMLKTWRGKTVAVAGSMIAVVGSASAALPTGATDAFTALSADGASMIDAGWPILVTIMGGLLLIKIFKKVAGKVT